MNTRNAAGRWPVHVGVLGAALLALLALLCLAAQSVGAAPTQPAPPAPGATATAAAAPAGPDPFPQTSTMTDTVLAVLRAYGQPGAGRGLADAGLPSRPAAGSGTLIFLPSVRARPLATPDPLPPTATPTPRPTAPPADMAVTLWPSPSIRVARGGRLSYELRVKNYGRGGASALQVSIPYSRQQISPIASTTDRNKGDWVSEVTGDRVTVTFGPFARGEERKATLVFGVGGGLPNDTVLSVRATYRWHDARSGGSGSSNWAPLLVGGGNDSAAWLWMAVDPQRGPAGTTHRFFTDRYIPGEGIYTWLNTPDGVKPLDLVGQADQGGRVWLDFNSRGRPPGMYSLVLYGARSNLTAVATFYVQ